MARVHVIFDPNDRVTALPPDVAKRIHISSATMQVDGEIDKERAAMIAANLSLMLLEQLNRSNEDEAPQS